VNVSCHAAFINASNCIILCSILVFIEVISTTADGSTSKSTTKQSMTIWEEVRLHIQKHGGQIYVLYIARQTHWNVIDLYHILLR